MRVLVTGGAGYIGSHTCKALALAGHEPIVFDNLIHGHRWAVRWGPLVVGDILDRAAIDAAITQYRPEAVIHFAAFAYVGESVSDPAKYYRNNVSGTLTLLEAMRARRLSRIVFSSSCATYGVPPPGPITEATVQKPINPYGMSKLMVEHMLVDFGSAYDLKWIALRYFNAAGADPSGEIGEAHSPETHIVPLVLAAAADPAKPFTIFGTDYDTPDGSCIRDYIHVSDLADAHVRALERLADGLESAAINLGTGRGASILEVLETAGRVTGRPIPVVHGKRRAGDPAILVSDAGLARERLGWRAKIPALGDILETAWSWHRRNQHPPSSDETPEVV